MNLDFIDAIMEPVRLIISSGCLGGFITLLFIGYLGYIAWKGGLLDDFWKLFDR